MMQWVGRQYVPYFNQKYRRTGTLWEGRYKATIIDSETYFMTCMRYIEVNPVRAGITGQAGDYRWSSYRHHAGLSADPLVTDHALYWALGNTPFERELAYRSLVAEVIPEGEVNAISEATNKGWALGGRIFTEGLERQIGRRTLPKRAGRPSKRIGEI
jgi:putative transposase